AWPVGVEHVGAGHSRDTRLDRGRHWFDDSCRHDARIARSHRPTAASRTRDANHLCGRPGSCDNESSCRLQRIHHAYGILWRGVDCGFWLLFICVWPDVSWAKAELGEAGGVEHLRACGKSKALDVTRP